MKVPRSIKDHYRNPIGPPPPASTNDLRHFNIPVPPSQRLQEQLKSNHPPIPNQRPPSPNQHPPTSSSDFSDQAIWLAALVRLHSDIALRLEKEKTKHLIPPLPDTTSDQKTFKFKPKSLKELASRACALEQAKELEIDQNFDSFSNSNPIVPRLIGDRSRVPSLDAIKPPALQRFANLPMKRRNSDPQPNSFLNTNGTSLKRSKLADPVKVYRPVVLPTSNAPFTKLELRPKDERPLLIRTLSDTKMVNGDVKPSSRKALYVPKTMKTVPSHPDHSDEPEVLTKHLTCAKEKHPSSDVYPLTNGVQDESSTYSDEEMHNSGKVGFSTLLGGTVVMCAV